MYSVYCRVMQKLCFIHFCNYNIFLFAELVEEFKVFAATANGINTINKLRKYYGEQTIPTAPVDVDGMPSNDELYDLVADPKYKTDPAFRRKVEQQFARAFPGKVDTGEI